VSWIHSISCQHFFVVGSPKLAPHSLQRCHAVESLPLDLLLIKCTSPTLRLGKLSQVLFSPISHRFLECFVVQEPRDGLSGDLDGLIVKENTKLG
jgi:hypothetical protein